MSKTRYNLLLSCTIKRTIIYALFLLALNVDSISASTPWEFGRYSNPSPQSFQVYAVTYLDDVEYVKAGKKQEIGFSFVTLQIARTTPYLTTYYHFNFYKGGKFLTFDGDWKVRYMTTQSKIRNFTYTGFDSENVVFYTEDAKIIRDDLLANEDLYFLITKDDVEIYFTLSSENYMNAVSRILLLEEEIPFNTWTKDSWGYDRFFIRSEENPNIYLELTSFIASHSQYYITFRFYEHYGDDFFGGYKGNSPTYSVINSKESFIGLPEYSGDLNFYQIRSNDIERIRRIFRTEEPTKLIFHLTNNQSLTFIFSGNKEFRDIDTALNLKV
ncbi:MAG: hypothetical protein GX638_15465, partial [Crenarchaeota archaeon]|nr:hypothetical protein [Thermoproteota archaeon]